MLKLRQYRGDVKITTSYKDIDLENVQGADDSRKARRDINIKGERL